jgi:hypothetical protein
MPKI